MRKALIRLAGALVLPAAAPGAAIAQGAQASPAPAEVAGPIGWSGAALLPQELEEIFASACFDGAVKLSAGQALPVPLNQLPKSLRRRFGNPPSAHVWKLNSAEAAYLYILNFAPSAKTIPVVCGLAAQSIDITPAIQFVGARVNGPTLGSFHDTFAGAEWLNADSGYVAVASKADSFTVLEVKQLTREQREIMKEKQPVPISPPSP